MKCITNVFGYALLLLISLTLSSCFIFRKNKSVTKSSTDSTAYNKIESTLNQHQSEAWKSYLHGLDSSRTMIYFYDGNEPEWIRIDTNGTIEAKGNIKEVVHKSGKQTTKKDSGNKQSKSDYRNINTNKTILKTVTITKTKEKKPDVKAIVIIVVVIALLLALTAFVVKKKLWFVKQWAKVINWLKGVTTGGFH